MLDDKYSIYTKYMTPWILSRWVKSCDFFYYFVQEAGCPDGVVNVIHGQHDCVNFICDHPDIR